MSKRVATTPLHQDNWDEEGDKEEAGSFTSATTEEMSSRTVKKARRRISSPDTSLADRTNSTPHTNVLSGFTGFTALTNNSATSSNVFNFGVNLKKTTEQNGNSTASTTSVTASSVNSVPMMTAGSFSNPITDSETASSLKQATTVGDFFRRLRVLNEAVVKWITMHVQQNPHCVLTPVFRDYEKYYLEMEQRFPNLISITQPTCTASLQDASPTSIVSASPTKLQRGSPLPMDCIRPLAKAADVLPGHFGGGRNTLSGPPVSAMETHGDEAVPVAIGIPSTISIMQLKPPKMDVPNTNLTSSKFSFASVPAATPNVETNDSESEEDPEVVEPHIPLEEEGSFYTKKCKLFYKYEGSFIEKGLGLLHLKKLDGKLQLVIRADTNLGTIMLNIIVIPSFPIERMGKNNVMICCIPNPIITPKMEPKTAIPLLIRVSSTEDADELFDKLKSNS
uniref:RanBD1 domain-containing protein n=1 Tax=Strigamia maritima TaxID=126957 RepID=T1IXV9_STRMM